MGLLSDTEEAGLVPASAADSPTPVPVRVVSSDEFLPIPQTERQKQVEARLNALGDEYGRKNGLSRRRFFQTAAGMATAFVAMNEVYGPIYGASPAEAKSVDLAQARADGLKDQFIMDVHTHFLRDDTRLRGLRRGPRGGGQGRLESRPGRQAADHRGPQVSELVQGDLSRLRHQGRADQRLALGRAARLVPDQRHEARCAHQGEHRRRFAPLPQPRDLHARLSRLDGRGRPRHRDAQARFVEGLHGRRQHPQGAGDASVADGRREAGLSVLREDRQGGLRHRLRAQGSLSARRSRSASRISRPLPASTMSARRRRTGRTSVSSSTTRPIAGPAAPARWPRTAMRSSSRPAGSNGPAISPTSRPSTASATSTPISARSSPRPRSSSHGCARR